MTTLTTDSTLAIECAPYPLPTDRDTDSAPPMRTSQYVGPIFDAEGTTSTYAPTAALALTAAPTTEPEVKP